MLLNKLRGFTPQASIDAPRFCISAGLPDAGLANAANAGDINSEIYLEEGIDPTVIEELRGMSFYVHPFLRISSSLFTSRTAETDICSFWDFRNGTRMRGGVGVQTDDGGEGSDDPGGERSVGEERLGVRLGSARGRKCPGPDLSGHAGNGETGRL